MSYIVLFLLLLIGCVLGAPISRESLQFRLVECSEGDNETLSTYVLQITDINATCIKVNKSSADGNDLYFYVSPRTDDGAQLRITTESCSIPLPDLHLTLCDEDPESSEDNSTEIMTTFLFHNISNTDAFGNDLNENDNSTVETFLYTDPTVYETLHRLDSDEDIYTTVTSSKSFTESEEKSSEDETI